MTELDNTELDNTELDSAAPGSVKPRVLVIRNAAGSGPGRLLPWLVDDGIEVIVWDGEQLLVEGTIAEILAGISGLVLLGGGFLPDADERARWLPMEREMTKQAVSGQIPMLGICLGGQLLALCAGGGVTGNSGEIERGSCPVELLPAAADDALFAPVLTAASGRTLRMIQNHRDSVTTLPPTATLLATSDTCRVQAFRIGDCAWGLQFHPEADASRMSSWNPESLTADGFDPDQVIATGLTDSAVNQVQARTLIGAFAAVVRAAAERPAVVDPSSSALSQAEGIN